MRLFKKKISPFPFIYWFLLVYIVSALIFWFLSLQKLNTKLADFEIRQVQATIDIEITPQQYENAYDYILEQKQRRTAQYIGEGLTFLIIILAGAFFVYRSIKKEILVTRHQQNFMMAITHELKTPIAISKLNLETLLKYDLDEEKKTKFLTNTLFETNRLNQLTSNILLASQFESGMFMSQTQDVNLSDLAQKTVKEFTDRYPQRNIQSNITPGILINGDELLLQMLINNLVENAFKYSSTDVVIHCEQNSGNVIKLIVADEGTGIPDAEKEKIFEKFYRIGTEETRKTKGTGLGLFLCKRIAEHHGATIKIENNKPQGTRFVVTF